ncbi:preimplantation protein isoform X2 [Bombyx mori]|uniref:Integrin beta epidermal growth factor-like domain-containing protein n=1 Tax=Bombyx mori TaxID=7091 RepID=A0A8R2C5C7_BOMMO|nr:integrin beta-8 isoform X1 [Bombyx mori]
MQCSRVKVAFLFLSVLPWTIMAAKRPFVMDERWVCAVKVSCFDCLKLSQCSWCVKENKCFSNELWGNKGLCVNDTIEFTDFGRKYKLLVSIVENAQCSCQSKENEDNCFSPEVTKGLKCSGRGTCVCGHCVCDTDAANPSKMIMGEYCEYDNFSCDGPKCTEGPYHISQVYENDGSFKVYRDDSLVEKDYSS